MNDILKELQKPFAENEIEWRVQQCGISNNKPWAMVLCYVQARAIQRRLDDVFGWDGWQVEYRTGKDDSNIICRLSAYDETKGQWIYKEDGASESNVEPFKGGISGALKRCASSGFGIGRYLYNLTETFAESTLEKPKSMEGYSKATTKDKKTIYWKIPKLPSWALPKKEKLDQALIDDLYKIAASKKFDKKAVDSLTFTKFKKKVEDLDIKEYEVMHNGYKNVKVS